MQQLNVLNVELKWKEETKMNKLNPPTYFFVLLIISFISHILFPIKQILISPYNYISLFLILFGTIINIWTDNLFKKAKTTVKPTHYPSYFITKGPFKISRHPMYLGMAAVLFGEAVLLGSLITFIFPIIFIILMETLFIPIEEENLQKKFGNKYLNYKNKVRRWI